MCVWYECICIFGLCPERGRKNGKNSMDCGPHPQKAEEDYKGEKEMKRFYWFYGHYGDLLTVPGSRPSRSIYNGMRYIGVSPAYNVFPSYPSHSRSSHRSDLYSSDHALLDRSCEV